MPPSRSALATALRAAVAGGLLAMVTTLFAMEGGFSTRLALEQENAAGLTRLTPGERAALDQLVAGELNGLHLTGDKLLSGTFVSRLTEPERTAAGLDRLSADELTRLNGLVAAAVASQPVPKERPRLKADDVISARAMPEVHGAVTLTYGRGAGGRDFRGADLSLNYYFPEYGLSLGFGLSRYSGDGLAGYCPGFYDAPDFRRDPFSFDAANPGILRDDFLYGTGESFRAGTSWGSLNYGRRRY